MGTALLFALLFGGVQPGCTPPSGNPDQDSGSTAPEATVGIYEGAWFKIAPPSGFTVRPSLPSETAEGYDSAFFSSPDGRVEFYVCSPQWGRDATDVALDPATESLLSDQTTESGGRTIQRLRITAQDGSYTRLVEIIFDQASAAQWVFGFRFADQLAHDEYLGRYEVFKTSLEQYAD